MRSVLQVRERPHLHPDRREEVVIEVRRAGQLVATIYGSLEGINVVTPRALYARPFVVEGAGPSPSWVLPLLLEGEECPWCENHKVVRVGGPDGEAVACPVCCAPGL